MHLSCVGVLIGMWGKAEEEAHLASPLNFIIVNFIIINFIIIKFINVTITIIVFIIINFNLITILHKIRNMMLISTPQSIFNIGFTITIIIPPSPIIIINYHQYKKD